MTPKRDTHSDVLDDEVIEDERVAGGAHAKADAEARQVDGETELLRPGGIRVRERENLWRDTICQSRRSARTMGKDDECAPA